ncbi:MAG TPA: hypothetical protein VMP67_00205 [Candidatus Limnocylindria bacterium]|nr:hypothetical protein [Candidatus Limnocylindria bacterium]
MLTNTDTFSPPARFTGGLLVTLLTASLAACTAAPPAGSPPPTPSASPTPGGSPINSPDPTNQPQPSPSPTQPTGGIAHPTGPTDVILRMETGGGFVPLGWMVTQAPEFTLYGDGTFLIKPLEDPDLPQAFDSAQPRFLQGRLDQATVQTLLAFALDQGRLREARENYRDDMIADAPTTVFTIDADGVSKAVSIYALSEVFEPRADGVDRAAFNELAELLRSFERRSRAGELGEVVLYEPTHYRVTLLEGFGQPVGEPVEWPWDDFTPDDFVATEEFNRPQAIMTAEDVALVTEVPSGGHPGIAVDYEGTVWLVGVRPLLPDEEPAG